MNSKKSIGVVDYGSGNLRSVCKALEAAGTAPRLVTSASEFSTLDAVVVPGQGAFGDCASNLDASGMRGALVDWIRADRAYLGICLGYQLLFDRSEESPDSHGLGIFPGRVVRFPSDAGLKIPHMGWNTLSGHRGPLFATLPTDLSFYFVHSYFPAPDDDTLVSAWCEYGGRFAASISIGNIHATQFHPEKSQAAGRALLRNFLDAL